MHKTASLADEGNSAYCQSSGAHDITEEDVLKSLKVLNQSKAITYNNIPIKMLEQHKYLFQGNN